MTLLPISIPRAVTYTMNNTKDLICESCPKNFIVLLGAPGIFNPKDLHHDRYWGNYFQAFRKSLAKAPPDKKETLHVIVYSKGYDDRYKDDVAKKGKNDGRSFRWYEKLPILGLSSDYNSVMGSALMTDSKSVYAAGHSAIVVQHYNLKWVMTRIEHIKVLF